MLHISEKLKTGPRKIASIRLEKNTGVMLNDIARSLPFLSLQFFTSAAEIQYPAMGSIGPVQVEKRGNFIGCCS